MFGKVSTTFYDISVDIRRGVLGIFPYLFGIIGRHLSEGPQNTFGRVRKSIPYKLFKNACDYGGEQKLVWDGLVVLDGTKLLNI